MTHSLDLSAHAEFAAIWAVVQPYSTTSIEGGFALWTAVNPIFESGIPAPSRVSGAADRRG